MPAVVSGLNIVLWVNKYMYYSFTCVQTPWVYNVHVSNIVWR